jgi:hypothetical protein
MRDEPNTATAEEHQPAETVAAKAATAKRKADQAKGRSDAGCKIEGVWQACKEGEGRG